MAYTEVTLDEASEIIKEAGFNGLVSIEKLEGGWANSNYKLITKDGTKLVLKIWNERNEEQVNYLLDVTRYLCDKGIPTPSPISFSNGEYLVIRDNLPWTILPYVEGKWLESNYESLFSLGKIQAQMHLIEPPNMLKNDFSMGISLFEKLFQIAEKNNEWTDFLILLKSSKSLFNKVEHLPKGIIHGDLFPDNVIGNDNSVISILDFEEVSREILAFDLIMTFVGFGWEKGNPVPERWNAILDGYQSIRKLSDEEFSSLSDLHVLATLSIAAWRYWQFKINFPGTEYEDRYLEMTSRLDKKLPF